MSSKKYLRYSLLSASMFTLLAFAIINHFKVMTTLITVCSIFYRITILLG